MISLIFPLPRHLFIYVECLFLKLGPSENSNNKKEKPDNPTTFRLDRESIFMIFSCTMTDLKSLWLFSMSNSEIKKAVNFKDFVNKEQEYAGDIMLFLYRCNGITLTWFVWNGKISMGNTLSLQEWKLSLPEKIMWKT